MGDPTGWKRRMQAYVDARHEELSQLEAELVGARATLDEHDAAVRDRAADLDSAARKLAAEEKDVRTRHEVAERQAAEARRQAEQASASERLAEQVRPSAARKPRLHDLLLEHGWCFWFASLLNPQSLAWWWRSYQDMTSRLCYADQSQSGTSKSTEWCRVCVTCGSHPVQRQHSSGLSMYPYCNVQTK